MATLFETVFTGFIANLLSGIILLGVSIYVINILFERQSRKQERREQQQEQNVAKIAALIQHLELLDDEITGLDKMFPFYRSAVEGKTWDILIFIPTSAWDAVRSNSEALGSLSKNMLAHLFEFYGNVDIIRSCTNMLVSSWFVNRSEIDNFQLKQEVLYSNIQRLVLHSETFTSKLHRLLMDEINCLESKRSVKASI